MVSDKQLEANQQNAKLGGVKTPAGKAKSKYNAQTHGILRHSVTDYEEGFYSDILEDLTTQYEPQGVIEQILIERVAIHYLKLFRVQKAETEYMKSTLNPRVVTNEMYSVLKNLNGKEEVLNEGYAPKVGSVVIEKLNGTYARYETINENRLFRALHELQRVQELRKGSLLQPPQ